MRNLKNPLSRLKRSTNNKVRNVKNKAQNVTKNFQKKISEAKNKPRSKRKSLFLGFTTILSIFGITLLAPILPAIAEELPNKGAAAKPKEICPAPPQKSTLVPSQQIVNGFSGAAATICALAVSSGSFMIGAVCGVVVVVGVLQAQGK